MCLSIFKLNMLIKFQNNNIYYKILDYRFV